MTGFHASGGGPTTAIAGHSHVDVTMMIYAHSGMTEQTEALRRLGETFGTAD